MTLDEAISLLKQYIDYNNPDIQDFYTMEEACEVVIKAFEQKQCGDCISREAVENAIKHAEVNFTVNSDIDFTKHKREVHEIVNGIVDAQIKALRDLPSVTAQPKMGSSSENQNKWIPVSERLPEKNDVYLVAVNSFGCPTRDVDGFIAHTDRKWEVYGNKVIAWMPLPEPYKSEIPTGQIAANGELYPGEFDDPLAEEGSDKECTKNI